MYSPIKQDFAKKRNIEENILGFNPKSLPFDHNGFKAQPNDPHAVK